jgi:hypothetical protein
MKTSWAILKDMVVLNSIEKLNEHHEVGKSAAASGARFMPR